MVGGFVFTHALRDFARGRRLLVWLLVAGLAYGIGLAYVKVNGSAPRQDTYVLLSSVLSYRILALAAAIFSMAVVAQEVEGRTIVYLLTRPVPRQALLLGRALAAAVVVFFVTSLSAIAVSLATRGSHNPLLAKDLIALAVGALAYTGFFTLVSLVLNRAMVACLLFAFGWETLAAGVPGDLKLLTLNTHVMALAERPVPQESSTDFLDAIGSMLGSTGVSANVAWIVLLVVIGATFAASMAGFSHFEYTAREDAE
jgi:ABC-2 type transport system permease protein